MFKYDPLRRRLDLDPRNPAFYENPYPAYEQIRALSPVFYWEQYGFWCFMGHEDVSALLRDRRLGRQITHMASKASLGLEETPEHLKPFYDVDDRSLLQLEPPAHTRLRLLINRAFVSRQVERLRPRVAQLTHELIDHFPKGEVDLLAAFATPLPATIIAEFMGVPREAVPDLLRWSHDMVAMYQFGRSRTIEDCAVKATLEFSDYLRQLLVEKRRNPGDDLIHVLLSAAPNGERLTEDELIGTCILLLNAGHEASVHAIGNGMRAALESGLDPASLCTDDVTSERFVEEILRFDAPLHLFDRYALEDFTLGDVALKMGDKIGLMLGAANRDPARFERAAQFDPSRAQNPHVSFGAGLHFCIGAPLARLEIQVAFKILFERHPRLALSRSPATRNSYHFHGLEALHLAI